MTDRETIYSNLFALVSSIPGFVTKSRRLQHWSDVPAIQQPALFQAQGSPIAETVDGKPTKWRLPVYLYLYCNSGEAPNATPSTQLNQLIDAIVAVLTPPPLNRKQTLGDTVERCFINGVIETDEGVLGNQAYAVIPIEILAV